MNAKKDLTDVADSLDENMAYLRTILTAAEDKIHFNLSNKALMGPYWELLSNYIAELGNLLALAERHLEKMDGEMEIVTCFLYQIDQPSGAK